MQMLIVVMDIFVLFLRYVVVLQQIQSHGVLMNKNAKLKQLPGQLAGEFSCETKKIYFFAFNSLVQCGQRIASTGIFVQQ